MKTCPRCNNLAEDNAASCSQCGMVLDQSVVARAARPRVPTITETPASFPPGPSPTVGSTPRSEYRPSPPPASIPRPNVSSSGPTQPVSSSAPASSGRRGHTVYLPSAVSTTAGSTPAPALAARRVVAVLVTYSWKPEGQVFPIREGRNLIGRGEECEVHVPEDPALSSTNSHITYRQSFTIGDMVSMSGTDLDGIPIEEQFRPLKNLAKIRAGSTNFLFVVVDPALLNVPN